MANRPDRNRNKNNGGTKKKTQAEINRVKPAGILTFDALREKSTRIQTINVKLPDGDIFEFYHLPMTVAQAEEFFETIKAQDSGLADVITAKRNMLTDQLVNKDGSKFVESADAWDSVDIQAVNALVDAILESPQAEAGED